MPSTTTEMVQEVGSDEAPGPSDLLTREDAVSGEGEDGLGADAKETHCLLRRYYLRIFLHLPGTP
jgi:hypothetical protein